jgi:hypothetical protein
MIKSKDEGGSKTKKEYFLLLIVLATVLIAPRAVDACLVSYWGQGEVYDSSSNIPRSVWLNLTLDDAYRNQGMGYEYGIVDWSINVQNLMSVSGNSGGFFFALDNQHEWYSQDWWFQPYPTIASNGTTWQFAGTFLFLNSVDYFQLPSTILFGGVFDGDNGLTAINPPFYLHQTVQTPVPATLMLFASALCGVIGFRKKFRK